MKARLYQFSYSPYCAKVRKILDYKGIDCETVEVDYVERHELLVVSGGLTVPVLKLADGETIADSGPIALRLEELQPEPTILPPDLRGVHLALTRDIETAVAEAAVRVAIADVMEYWGRRGADRLAFFRMTRERRFGAGFCDRMVRERAANLAQLGTVLAPFEDALTGKAFLLGRIGLADFALYGQLSFLGFTGELRIPSELTNLCSFFCRMDRISAVLDDAAL